MAIFFLKQDNLLYIISFLKPRYFIIWWSNLLILEKFYLLVQGVPHLHKNH